MFENFQSPRSSGSIGYKVVRGFIVAAVIALFVFGSKLFPQTLQLHVVQTPAVSLPQLKLDSPEHVARASSRTSALSVQRFAPRPFTAPSFIPKLASVIEDALDVVFETPNSGVSLLTSCPACAAITGIDPMLRTSPPPSAPKVVEEKRKDEAPRVINQGGNVQQALLRYQEKPFYPPLAKQAGVSGTVRLSALIAIDGKVKNLTVISGHPLLVPAAILAVSKWAYRPTLLNGQAVEVQTQIDVNFNLNR